MYKLYWPFTPRKSGLPIPRPHIQWNVILFKVQKYLRIIYFAWNSVKPACKSQNSVIFHTFFKFFSSFFLLLLYFFNMKKYFFFWSDYSLHVFRITRYQNSKYRLWIYIFIKVLKLHRTKKKSKYFDFSSINYSYEFPFKYENHLRTTLYILKIYINDI